MQALALAAARTLHEAGADAPQGITILAAGSDGRDGATDAAGAVVNNGTWAAIQSAGHDPAALLAVHDSHAALRAAGCLIPAFASGTNVNDLVLALVEPRGGYGLGVV
jgi:hydroxypyruvate reductase